MRVHKTIKNLGTDGQPPSKMLWGTQDGVRVRSVQDRTSKRTFVDDYHAEGSFSVHMTETYDRWEVTLVAGTPQRTMQVWARSTPQGTSDYVMSFGNKHDALVMYREFVSAVIKEFKGSQQE